MKKLLLLASGLLLVNVSPVLAEEDNTARIAEIEAQIKELQAELKELKGSTSDEVVVVDDENVRAVFKEIVEKKDLKDRPTYEFVFEVENKTEKKFEAQVDSVSIDGTMVDRSFIFMSQEVGPKKKAKAVLKLQSYTDDEIPELEGDLELTFVIFNWEDMTDRYEYPFTLNLSDYQ